MEQKDIKGVITNYNDFTQAVANAQLDGVGHLEVTPDLFKSLTKGITTEYLTWGHPGVKIYIEGTKERIDEEESMNVEDWYVHSIKNKSHAKKQTLKKK